MAGFVSGMPDRPGNAGRSEVHAQGRGLTAPEAHPLAKVR